VRVVPFDVAHLEAAAALLARTLGASAAGWGLATTVSSLTVARQAIAAGVDGGQAVVALDAASLAGFMIAPLPNVPGPGSSRMTITHHAAEPAAARAAYRRMYEHIAADLVAAGCFRPSIVASLDQHSAVTALFELGFGIDQIKGVRHLTTHVAPPASTDLIRGATLDDLDGLIDLSIELQI
jgi:hypothetical protein